MKNNNDIILQRVRNLIDTSGCSRQVIANAIGCDVSTITKQYNGDRIITVDYIIKYATIFNVSADYLLGLSNTPTTDKNIQFVCDYTGLEENTIEKLRKGKNSVFYTTLLNFLINNNILLKSLNNYLLSSIYIEYNNSNYSYLPTKKDIIFLHNPDIAQKVAYSNLFEVLSLHKNKMTEQIKNNQELKENLLYALAKETVDIEKCKRMEASIKYGPLDCSVIEEYENSPSYKLHNQDQWFDSLDKYYDELFEGDIIDTYDEDIEIKSIVLEFMDKISKEVGEYVGNNPET